MQHYEINNTKGELEYVLVPGSVNGPGMPNINSDLRTYGAGHQKWGEGVNENFFRLAENFNCPESIFIDGQPKNAAQLGIAGAGINSPLDGQIWFNSTKNKLFVYTANALNWTDMGVATYATTAPISPSTGDLWVNSSTNVLSGWDTGWITFGLVISSATPPAMPTLNTIWRNSTTNTIKIWIPSWKPISGVDTSTTQPSNPNKGDLWFDFVNGELYVWDGTQWVNPGYTKAEMDSRFVHQVGNETITGSLTVESNSGKTLILQPGTNLSTLIMGATDGSNTTNRLDFHSNGDSNIDVRAEVQGGTTGVNYQGNLTIYGNMLSDGRTPTNTHQFVTKSWTEGQISTLASSVGNTYVSKVSDTTLDSGVDITFNNGRLLGLSATPTLDDEAASKKYVDDQNDTQDTNISNLQSAMTNVVKTNVSSIITSGTDVRFDNGSSLTIRSGSEIVIDSNFSGSSPKIRYVNSGLPVAAMDLNSSYIDAKNGFGIRNLTSSPVNAGDATSKAYVDAGQPHIYFNNWSTPTPNILPSIPRHETANPPSPYIVNTWTFDIPANRNTLYGLLALNIRSNNFGAPIRIYLRLYNVTDNILVSTSIGEGVYDTGTGVLGDRVPLHFFCNGLGSSTVKQYQIQLCLARVHTNAQGAGSFSGPDPDPTPTVYINRLYSPSTGYSLQTISNIICFMSNATATA